MEYKFKFYKIYRCGESEPTKFHCKPIGQKEYEKCTRGNAYFVLIFSEIRNQVFTTICCAFPYHDPWISSDICTLLGDCHEFIPNGCFLNEFPSASPVGTCGNEEGEDKDTEL